MAQPSADALFEQGRALLQENRVDEACEAFAQSHRQDPALGTLLNLADCHERQGKAARAHQAFVEAARWAARRGETRREEVARARAAALEPRLVLLDIDARRAATVTVREKANGATAFEGPVVEHTPIALHPGLYALRAVAEGAEPFETNLELVRPGHATLRVEFKPVEARPIEPPAARSRPGLLIGGLTGGLLASAGLVTVVATQLTFAAVARQQPGGPDAATPTVTRSEYETASLASPFGLVALVGGLVLTGVMILLGVLQ